MQTLPTETLLSIFLSLSLPDILATCSADSRFASFCRDEYLWKLLVKRDFPEFKGKVSSWKKLYQELYFFSHTLFFLTLTNDYYQESFEKEEEEWLFLSWELRSLLGKKEAFYLPAQNVNYEIEDGKIIFFFQILPRTSGLTIHDFFSFFSSLKKEVREANRKGEEFFISLGKLGYFLEEF